MRFVERFLPVAVPALVALGSAALSVFAGTGSAAIASPTAAAASSKAPPPRLSDTGLYVKGAPEQVHPDNLEFSPRYPLWSDGATKRRWLNLPPGTYIDASNPDAWEFPAGTRLWKEFSDEGRRIETRLIQRQADGSWTYATYIWDADGADATLAPNNGIVLATARAPGGGYVVPSRGDCLACHEGAAVPVLGASAFQLAPDQPSKAPIEAAHHPSAVNLRSLVERGLVRNLPASLLTPAPQVYARSPLEQAALGYLHGNCGHCHNHDGAPAAVPLVLAQAAGSPEESRRRVLESAVGARSRFRPPGASGQVYVIVAGRPEASVLNWRMQSRHPLGQMPPLGTLVPDPDGISLIERWISTELKPTKETSR